MKNILLKAHKAMVWYSVLCSPITVFYVYWFIKYKEDVPEGGLLSLVNAFGLAWVLSLVYLVLALCFYPTFRETILARLAGFKERDEREELVTAAAARGTFLLTLAVQIALLIMSMTSFHLVRNPDGHGFLALGIEASSDQLLDIYSLPAAAAERGAAGAVEIEGHLMPPNITLILLLLILVEVGSFKFFSRRRYEGLEG